LLFPFLYTTILLLRPIQCTLEHSEGLNGFVIITVLYFKVEGVPANAMGKPFLSTSQSVVETHTFSFFLFFTRQATLLLRQFQCTLECYAYY